MISRLGLLISRIFRRTAPDPFVLAILLSLLTAFLALAFGQVPHAPGTSTLLALFDAWRSTASPSPYGEARSSACPARTVRARPPRSPSPSGSSPPTRGR